LKIDTQISKEGAFEEYFPLFLSLMAYIGYPGRWQKIFSCLKKYKL